MDTSKLSELVRQIEALGLKYSRASYADDEEQEYLAADEFLYEVRHLREMLDTMELFDEITRQPTAPELHALHERLYRLVMAGEWGGASEDSMRALICEVVPQIRA